MRLKAVSIDFDFYKSQCLLSRSRLNAFVFVLEHVSREEENESQTSLALYIGLDIQFQGQSGYLISRTDWNFYFKERLEV